MRQSDSLKILSRCLRRLQVLSQGWQYDTGQSDMSRQGSGYGPGKAPFERLPNEILSMLPSLFAF